MTYLKLSFALIAAAIIGSVSVAAAGPLNEAFGAMDADADGLVTEAEFVTYSVSTGKHTEVEAAEKFAEMAGDDAVLTYSEFEAAHSAADGDRH